MRVRPPALQAEPLPPMPWWLLPVALAAIAAAPLFAINGPVAASTGECPATQAACALTPGDLDAIRAADDWNNFIAAALLALAVPAALAIPAQRLWWPCGGWRLLAAGWMASGAWLTAMGAAMRHWAAQEEVHSAQFDAHHTIITTGASILLLGATLLAWTLRPATLSSAQPSNAP